MKAPENIDDILQKGLENFNPTPPADVWAHLEQNLGHATPSAGSENISNVAKIAKSIKAAGLLSKIAAIAFIPAVLGVYLFNSQFSEPKKNTVPNIAKVIKLEPSHTQKEAFSAEPTPALQNTSTTTASPKVRTQKTNTVLLNSEPVQKNTTVENGSNPTVPADLVQNNVNALKENKPGNTMPNRSETKDKWDESLPKVVLSNDSEKVNESQKELIAEEPKFYNGISPNGDGINDRFEIDNVKNAVYYHLAIYDKLENLVFESNRFDNTWNGTHFKTGEECIAGVYKYIFEYQMNPTQPVKFKKGSLTLVR